MTHELDGTYQVSSTTSYNGPLEKKSDGLTEIKDGQTMRRDDANCLWTSTFTILNENEVEMISVADPSEADGDFSLTKPDGSPTREPVTYKATLRLARKGDKIQLSGQVEYDNDITLLTMRKMG
jgi:hypothetical protein